MCVHGTMDEVYVSHDERSEGWWDDGRCLRFPHPMDDAGRTSMGRFTRSHNARVDLRGGGTMDDGRVFLAQWTMLGAHPWDDGRGSCITL